MEVAVARVTYAEVRQWAVWLQFFTASEIADAMSVPLEMGERAVKMLLWHGICEETGASVDGPDGPEAVISYVPLPPGPTHHPHEPPPEVTARLEMGGDPLRVVRGYPIGSQRDPALRSSQTGQWRPGRTQRPSKRKRKRDAEFA